MKIIIISIVILSVFQSTLSLKCYSCNFPLLKINGQQLLDGVEEEDRRCAHPRQMSCPISTVCGKLSANQNGAVVKHCWNEHACKEHEEKGEKLDCCKNDLCNASDNLFENKLKYFTLVYVWKLLY